MSLHFLFDTLAGKLVFRPKIVIGFGTQPNNALTFPLNLEKTWSSLIIRFMFRRMVRANQLHLSCSNSAIFLD